MDKEITVADSAVDADDEPKRWTVLVIASGAKGGFMPRAGNEISAIVVTARKSQLQEPIKNALRNSSSSVTIAALDVVEVSYEEFEAAARKEAELCERGLKGWLGKP
jgi:hypothetical protein